MAMILRLSLQIVVDVEVTQCHDKLTPKLCYCRSLNNEWIRTCLRFSCVAVLRLDNSRCSNLPGTCCRLPQQHFNNKAVLSQRKPCDAAVNSDT